MSLRLKKVHNTKPKYIFTLILLIGIITSSEGVHNCDAILILVLHATLVLQRTTMTAKRRNLYPYISYG